MFAWTAEGPGTSKPVAVFLPPDQHFPTITYMTVERRHRRGATLGDALNFQLAACVEDEGLEAMVLADGDGLCVANWGDIETCEEAAGRAPLPGGQARSVRFGGMELYLCAVGGKPAARRRSLDRSAKGVSRILGTWLVP